LTLPKCEFISILRIQFVQGLQRAEGDWRDQPRIYPPPSVARKIRQLLGELKILICLREPLDRAFSHYHHALRTAEDNRSFYEACQSDAGLPLWCERHDDFRRAYVRGSWYAYQIEEWRQQFGHENRF